MFAAGEMQISGEPFAENFVGRNLDGYDRFKLPTNLYDSDQDPATDNDEIDLVGFSTAVESYEYSKYHMNIVANQAGAGVSLAHGPLVAALDPDKTVALRTRVQQLLVAAGSDVGGFAQVPAPADNGLNRLGFGGLVPTMIPWREFDPGCTPRRARRSRMLVRCGLRRVGHRGDRSRLRVRLQLAAPHRHVRPGDRRDLARGGRARHLERSIVGHRLHQPLARLGQQLRREDRAGRFAERGQGRQQGEGRRRRRGGGNLRRLDAARGHVGPRHARRDRQRDRDAAAVLHDDRRCDAGWIRALPPMRWPTTTPRLFGGFPRVSAPPSGRPSSSRAAASPTIADAASKSTDLAALLLGASMAFGMTDARNEAVGQSIGLTATFDGDPFPADNGKPDGEATLHDRLLGLLKVAFVDLDRMHADPKLGCLGRSSHCRDGKRSSAEAGLGDLARSLHHRVATAPLVRQRRHHAIRRSGPEPHRRRAGIFNATPFTASGGATFSARVRALTVAQGDFVYDWLSEESGKAKTFATLAADGGVGADASPTTIEAQAAVVRALTETFLLTQNEKYRVRARAVATRLESTFYAAGPALYRGVDGGADEITVSPETFAWLQSALRETYKVLSVAGDPALDRTLLEPRIVRVNKLFLNGWDDRNRDRKVDVKTECLSGRLQLAEQALTGELGKEKDADTSDRDSDCVPEVDDAASLATLAASVKFHAP